jgi:hypothetical protein
VCNVCEPMPEWRAACGAAGSGAALTRWLVGNRWTWPCRSDGSLTDFLNELPPSQVPHNGLGAWIAVHKPAARNPAAHDSEDEQERHQEDYADALKDVDSCIAQGTRVAAEVKNKCIRRILEIAKQRGCTSGKWMLQLSYGDGDAIWRKIATATVEGRLGCSAKISPAGGSTKHITSDELLLCCIYSSDFTDKPAVKRLLHSLETELEGMGSGGADIEVKWGFKPDVYTELGIYSNNDRGKKLGVAIYPAKDARKDVFEHTAMPWEEVLLPKGTKHKPEAAEAAATEAKKAKVDDTPMETITTRRGVAEGGYSYRLRLVPSTPTVTLSLASTVTLVVMHASTGRGWRCTTTLHQLEEQLEESGMVSPQAPQVLEWLLTAARALKPTPLLSDMFATCSCQVGRAGMTASFR